MALYGTDGTLGRIPIYCLAFVRFFKNIFLFYFYFVNTNA